MKRENDVMQPIHLTPSRLDTLHLEAIELSTGNHRQFLSEALASLARGNSPSQTLAHLEALHSSDFVTRVQPTRALHSIVEWLRLHLQDEPDVDASVLAHELGWIRRLSHYHEKAKTPIPVKPIIQRSDRASGSSKATLADAQWLPLPLSRTPQATVEDARREPRPLSSAATDSTGPLHGPSNEKKESPFIVERTSFIQVTFVDSRVAAESRKSRKKRIQANKELKEQWITLCPVEPLAQARLTGLLCELGTPGIEEIFQKMEKAGGKQLPFFVTELVQHEGTWRANRACLSIQPPSSDKQSCQ